MTDGYDTDDLPTHLLDVPLISDQCAYCRCPHQPGALVIVEDVEAWHEARELWDALSDDDREVINRWTVTVDGACCECASGGEPGRQAWTAEQWQQGGTVAVHVTAFQLQACV